MQTQLHSRMGNTYRLGLHTRHNINIILIVLSYRQLAIACLCANHKPCALTYLSRRRRVAHKSGGNRLVSGEREARRDGGTEQIAGRRGHLGLADLVAQSGASHGGIGARECAERRAGGGVAVHGGKIIQLFVVVGLARRRKEKPRVRPDSSVNSPNWPFKKLDRSRRVEIKGIHPENDLITKSTAWAFREGTNKNIQK